MLYELCGMSFREYLEFRLGISLKTYSFDTILENPEVIIQDIVGIDRLKGHFRDFLNSGYYPFLFEDEKNYHRKIMNIINKTIYEDISNYYKLKTENLIKFKKILSFLATIPPGELNRNTISKHIGLDNKTVENYLNILNETGLVCLIKEKSAGE